MLTTETIYATLEKVKDPEIPVLSLVDLGIIREVEVRGTQVRIVITPTFVGCPALEMMKQEITQAVLNAGADEISIEVSFTHPWSSDHITEKGKKALREFGLAPPPLSSDVVDDLDILEHAECPRCGGTDTDMKATFGATLCRSMHYCNHCREAFEQFKPI